MYSDVFCKVYNEFGWNYYPEAFGQQLLEWMEQNGVRPRSSLDLACGTGILCEILHNQGIEAWGMDFSEGMIHIARESCPEIHYDVADMILYCPDRKFDLVTCTGDSLNHIIDLADVERIFRNVYGYLHDGGYFIFDILNEKEISTSEPFDLEFSSTVTAQFQMTQDRKGIVNLRTKVYENGRLQFEEVITETVHDPDRICGLLRGCGFQIVKFGHQLPDRGSNQATTWFIIAKK